MIVNDDGHPEAEGALTIEVSRDGERAEVTARGEIDLASSPRLRDELVVLADEGMRDIVVDLAGVGFIDSSGLGVLVGALKRTRELGGTLTLRGLDGPVRKVFEITGLHELFVTES